MQYYREGPYALSEDPPIWAEFQALLRENSQPDALQEVERFAFYEAAQKPEVCLTVQTGDQRVYANLLLTIGVIKPD